MVVGQEDVTSRLRFIPVHLREQREDQRRYKVCMYIDTDVDAEKGLWGEGNDVLSNARCIFSSIIIIVSFHFLSTHGASLALSLSVSLSLCLSLSVSLALSLSLSPPSGNRLAVVGGLACPYDLASGTRGGCGPCSAPVWGERASHARKVASEGPD